jgi:hypothetical protein
VAKGTAEPASYRQCIPPIDLSLERYTESVPKDGYYYVLLRGEIKGRFRTRNAAAELYTGLLRQTGYKPPPVDKTTPRNEAVEGYLDAKESYWADSHKHARRGGKGRY